MKRGEKYNAHKGKRYKLGKIKKAGGRFYVFQLPEQKIRTEKHVRQKKYVLEEKRTFAKNCEFHVFDGFPSSLQWRGQKPIQHA